MIQPIINELAKKINYNTDPGITIEITDCLKCEDNISEYNIEFLEDKRYKINITLEKYNIQEAKKVFTSLLHFIEYSAATFYVRTKSDKFVEYLLLSSMEDGTGFFCQIIFTPKI